MAKVNPVDVRWPHRLDYSATKYRLSDAVERFGSYGQRTETNTPPSMFEMLEPNSGSFVIWGRPETGSADPVPVYFDGTPHVDVPENQIRQGLNGVSWVDVRAIPLIDSPNCAQLIDGSGVLRIIHSWIYGDPQVKLAFHLFKQAFPAYDLVSFMHEHPIPTSDGLMQFVAHYPEPKSCWHTFMSYCHSIVADFLENGGPPETAMAATMLMQGKSSTARLGASEMTGFFLHEWQEKPMPPEFEWVYIFLNNKFMRLWDMIFVGELVVRGRHCRASAVEIIDRVVWENPDHALELRTGNIIDTATKQIEWKDITSHAAEAHPPQVTDIPGEAFTEKAANASKSKPRRIDAIAEIYTEHSDQLENMMDGQRHTFIINEIKKRSDANTLWFKDPSKTTISTGIALGRQQLGIQAKQRGGRKKKPRA